MNSDEHTEGILHVVEGRNYTCQERAIGCNATGMAFDITRQYWTCQNKTKKQYREASIERLRKPWLAVHTLPKRACTSLYTQLDRPGTFDSLLFTFCCVGLRGRFMKLMSVDICCAANEVTRVPSMLFAIELTSMPKKTICLHNEPLLWWLSVSIGSNVEGMTLVHWLFL